MKLFEDRQRKAGKANCSSLQIHCSQSLSGKPVSHEFAKELLAGIAGGEADRLAETKGTWPEDEILLIQCAHIFINRYGLRRP